MEFLAIFFELSGKYIKGILKNLPQNCVPIFLAHNLSMPFLLMIFLKIALNYRYGLVGIYRVTHKE